MRLITAILFLTASLCAQTNVYLRSSGPAAVPVIGATNATPVVIQTQSAHGFNAGDTIMLGGVCTGSGPSPVNGIRKVKAIIDATDFSITDLSGVDIAGNGAWCDGSGSGWIGAPQWTGKVTPYTLGSQPLGFYDGPNGTVMRKVALGTQNGLASSGGLTVTGNVATATTTYNHGINVGDQISIWGTTSNALNTANGSGKGTPYTVTSVTPTTFQFTTTGVANGDYTTNMASGPAATPNDTIGNTQNAVRISQLAYTGNPFYDSLINESNSCSIDRNQGYKAAFDGGNVTTYTIGNDSLACYSVAAVRFVFDQSNAQLVSVLTYFFNHIERMNGVNWTLDESYGQPNVALYADGGELFDSVAFLYEAISTYVSAAEKAVFLNKIWNDLDDPSVTACSKADADLSTGNHNVTLATGTAQGGTGNSITLASSDSAATNHYVNNVVAVNGNYCIVSAYNASTKVATCNSTWTAPSSGAAYTIYGTITISTVSSGSMFTSANAQAGTANSITLSASDGQATGFYVGYAVFLPGTNQYGVVTAYNGATKVATISGTWTAPTSGTLYSIVNAATITGINTHFTTETAAGQGIMGANGYNQTPSGLVSVILTVNSDTSLTVINGPNLNYQWQGGGATPAQVWYFVPWQTGDCGLIWGVKHSLAFYGAQPKVYPAAGGAEAGNAPYGPGSGSNFVIPVFNSHIAAGLSMAADDPRAAWDLTLAQSGSFDYILAHYMDYGAGWLHSGSLYSGIVGGNLGLTPWILQMSVPSFPSMDQANTSGWLSDLPFYKMYNAYPDTQYYPPWGEDMVTPGRWGAEDATNELQPKTVVTGGYVIDPNFVFNPSSPGSQYLRNWLTNIPGYNMWSTNGVQTSLMSIAFLHNDPRIGSLNYTTQPHQYLFQSNSAATCASLTGWPCPATFRGDAAVSRTGLSSKTDTWLRFESRAWWGDHDNPENGMLSVYKAGELLNTDQGIPGAGIEGDDNTTVGDMLQFGGSSSLVGGSYSNTPGMTPITMWGSANHGSWSAKYGDQASQYMWLCSNLAGVYTTTTNYAQRCIAHLKPTSGEELIVQWDSVSVPSPTSIATHVHYTQNGETGVSAYPEGHTTCPGTGGCGSLNSNRSIRSLETGTSDAFGDPTPNYGLITTFLSPGTITVNWDCPNNLECSPSSSYPGGSGHTDRVSVCGGSSCGAPVSTFESMIVHKVAANLTDTTLTTTALNPDPNWTGFQSVDKVVLMARGGSTHSSISGFTTTHSGTAQYLFGGLTPGVYTVTISGTPVSGSPFTVSANDNSIEFDSTAGTLSVNGSASTGSSIISGQATVNGNAVIH
jgi:hypothetical protein